MRSELERLADRRDVQRRELNKYSVEIQKKYAIPIAAIVFVLIGAPIGVRFPRGGIGMVIGVSLTVFCVYYVFLIGGEEFADSDIVSPFWAMWTPNLIFAALGCAILVTVSRSGTRRAHPVFGRLRGLFAPSPGDAADEAQVERPAE
jgi:lipopolysaccharide export system permease protein